MTTETAPDPRPSANPEVSEAEQHQALLPARILDLLMLLATAVFALSVLAGGSTDSSGRISADIGTATRLFVLSSTFWILLGLVYAGVRIRRIRKARQGDQRWPGWLAGRRRGYLITLGTSVIVLGAGGNVAIAGAGTGADNGDLIRIFGITTIVVAWTILQLSYAERYARLYLESTEDLPPLDFPGTPHPSLLEFAYFSFTVGTTFATSDVSVQSSRLRGIVLCHGLLAFVYNTALLGMAISLLTG